MRYNRPGKTGLFASELCLGTMTFGKAGGRYAAASGFNQQSVEATNGPKLNWLSGTPRPLMMPDGAAARAPNIKPRCSIF
jgi:hypothetical protein